MTAEAAGLFLDYSKNRITAETIQLLLNLANESGLRQRIDAMFSGEKINLTENRAVLHVALRAPRGTSIVVDGENVVPAVHEVLDRMSDFSRRVRSGDQQAATDLVAIGFADTLLNRGVRIPQDISVVGFGNTITSEYFRVPMTTVRQPKFRLGLAAVEMMSQLLRGQRAETKRLPAELIVRASTAEPGVGAHPKAAVS